MKYIKFKLFLLLLIVILVVASCAVTPGKSLFGETNFAGQAIAGFSDRGCVRGDWYDQDVNGQITGPFNGCTNFNDDVWCATKTVNKNRKKVYVYGGKEGTAKQDCTKARDKSSSLISKSARNTVSKRATENSQVIVPNLPSQITTSNESDTIQFIASDEFAKQGVRIDDLKLSKVYCDKPVYEQHNAKVCSAFYKQYYQNLEVFGALAGVTTINGKVVGLKNDYYSGISVSLLPKITKEEAETIVSKEISTTKKPIESSLVIYPQQKFKGYDYFLAWKVHMPLLFDLKEPHQYVYLVNAVNGEVLEVIDEVTTFSVTGEVFPEHPKQDKTVVPFAHEWFLFDINGVKFLKTTDTSGKVDASGTILEGLIEEGSLQGPHVYVINLDGKKAQFKGPSGDSLNWKQYDLSYKGEDSNVFYHINKIHDFFTKGDPFNVNELNTYPVSAYLEYKENSVKSECNAFMYFAQGKMGVIVFTGSGLCEASSLFSDLIYHEYTHVVVGHIYINGLKGIGERGGMNEGLADYFASSLNNNACFVEFFTPGIECERNLKNTLKYPADFEIEAHGASKVFSSSLWDIHELLGQKVTDELVIRTMKLQSGSFSEFITNMLTIDDDNGDLKDGTPHITQICGSFYGNHGLFAPACAGYVNLPVVFIADPSPGPFLKSKYQGKIEVVGTVLGSTTFSLQNYVLEISKDGSAWEKIGVGTTSVLNGVLGVINKQLGVNYVLRLTATSTTGQTKEFILNLNSIKCEDIDGSNYYKKGALAIQTLEVFTDFCSLGDVTSSGAGIKKDESNYVYEYYCMNNKDAGTVIVKCPSGCKDGACIDVPIVFADPNLEKAIKEQLNIPLDKSVTASKAASYVDYLDLSFKSIKELDGLEYFTNVKQLFLDSNQISDISALKGMTQLTYLDLKNNQISDISTLKGMAELIYLYLGNNQISDISALKGMTQLIYLNLGQNQISDISALKGMTQLTKLILHYNQITDISALQNLINLQVLYLSKNSLSQECAVSVETAEEVKALFAKCTK